MQERIRTLGGQASVVPRDLESGSSLKPANGDLHKMAAREIVRSVAEDMEALVADMRESLKVIDSGGDDQGTSDLLAGTLRAHEKHVWMLRAHLGE